jgi:NADH dehydrogenase FAD-containing subunit
VLCTGGSNAFTQHAAVGKAGKVLVVGGGATGVEVACEVGAGLISRGPIGHRQE